MPAKLFLKFLYPESPYLSDFQPKNGIRVYSYNLQLITADNYSIAILVLSDSLACSYQSSSSLSEPEMLSLSAFRFVELTLQKIKV